MNVLNSRQLKARARQTLAGASYDHKKLALVHTGIIVAVNILVCLLQLYLSRQIESAGGLSGLGTRTILETAQTVLMYAVNLVLPFWEMGFVYAALRLARGETTDPQDLKEGFHRFGPVLRLYLMEGLIYVGAGMICLNIGAAVFSLTSMSQSMQDMFLSMEQEGYTVEQMMEAAQSMPLEELAGMMWPALLIVGILFLVLAAGIFYRFRVARFAIMDRPGTGALAALLISARVTKGRRMQLFRLDLSFWWFYLLVAVSGVAMYTDVLLANAGVQLPLSADALWIGSYVLGCLIQLVVYWQYHGYVQTTCATAYETLMAQPMEPPAPRPAPEKLPWDDSYQTQE